MIIFQACSVVLMKSDAIFPMCCLYIAGFMKVTAWNERKKELQCIYIQFLIYPEVCDPSKRFIFSDFDFSLNSVTSFCICSIPTIRPDSTDSVGFSSFGDHKATLVLFTCRPHRRGEPHSPSGLRTELQGTVGNSLLSGGANPFEKSFCLLES